jgi:amino-acid N-acetyltransferase
MMINAVTQNIFSKALAFIKDNNLPSDDISDSTKLFAITDGDKIVGTIGVEFYEKAALLRSLAVSEERRGAGLAKQLVDFIEHFAKQNGAEEIILLTTTAQDFFNRRTYEIIERENTPEGGKKSTEFASTCPSSAVVMKKRL